MADVSGTAGRPGGTDGEGDMGAKYAKRSSGVRRSLQRLFPGLFQPGLPVTTRCRPHPCWRSSAGRICHAHAKGVRCLICSRRMPSGCVLKHDSWRSRTLIRHAAELQCSSQSAACQSAAWN